MTRYYLTSILLGAAISACGTDQPEDLANIDQESSVHLKGGPRAEPAFRDQGLTLTTTASLSGLGGGDVDVTLDATGNADARCTNPGGSTEPAGHNPAPTNVTGGVAIPSNQIKNGTLTFTLATEAPTTPVPGAPDCPNPNWTQSIVDMAFTSATITVEQPPGTAPVFVLHCDFSPETSNGSVPAGTVTCY